jgi:hypothetical protein
MLGEMLVGMSFTRKPKHYTYDKKRCDWVVQFWDKETKRLKRIARCSTEAKAKSVVQQYLFQQQENLTQELKDSLK